MNAKMQITTWLLLSAISLGSGCKKEENAEQGQNTAAGQLADLGSLDMGKTIAKVNGVELKQKTLDIYLDNFFAIQGIGEDQRKEIEADPRFAMQKTQFVDRMIGMEALRQKAITSDVAKDPTVALKIQFQSDQIMVEAYLTKLAEAKVTEESLKQKYEDTKVQHQVTEVEITIFTLETSVDADAVKAIVESKGDVNAKLAELKSEGSTQTVDMGMFEKSGMKPQVEATDAGGFIGPLPFMGKFQFIRVDKKTDTLKSFEDVKAALKTEATQEAMITISEEIRKNADVTQFTDDEKPVEGATETNEKPSEEKKDEAGHNH